VSGVSLAYQFQRTASAAACAYCGQGSCYRREYRIQMTVTQDGTMTVTRRNVGTDPAGNQCCWYGTGFVSIAYTVEWQEYRECSNALNKTWPLTTYSGTTVVPCCVHVTCSTGGGLACVKDFGNVRTYIHTLDICSFPIACNDVTVAGAINADDECGAVTCDSGANCDRGPYSLWCIGGQVSHRTAYKCLDTLTSTDWACLGYYASARCMASCAGVDGSGNALLPQRISSTGPFSCGLYEECDAGGGTTCDTTRMDGSWLPTTFGTVGSQPYDDLRSYCGGVDWASADACREITVLQTACGARWTYS